MTSVDAPSIAPERTRLLVAVRAALSEVLERDIAYCTESTSLFQELGLDSTGVLDLLMLLEEALGLEFDTDNLEMAHFSTVGTLADFLASEMDS